MNVSINIFDYTNTATTTGYALSVCPFYFTNNFPLTGNYLYLWDFGDNTFSTLPSATHTFLQEGVYQTKLTIIDSSGNIFSNTLTPVISVYNYIDNKLYFNQTSTPFYNIPAGELITPLIINRVNSWQFTQNSYSLFPYISGALGGYLTLSDYNSNQWSHLNCYNKFYTYTNNQYVPVNSYNTIDTCLYATVSNSSITLCASSVPNSFFVGTSGYAQIYFTSDIPKNFDSTSQPSILFVSQNYNKYITQSDISLSALSYINTKPAILPNIKINNNVATNLSFSTNGIDTEGVAILTSFNIPPISWQNTTIPFVVNLKDINSFNTRFYPLLSANNINQTCNSVTFCLSTQLVDGNSTLIPNVSFYTDYISNTDYSRGGYFKGYFICPTTVNNCTLSSLVAIQNNESYNLDTIGNVFYSPATQTLYNNVYTLQYNSQFESLCANYINRQIITPLSATLNNTQVLSSTPLIYVSPITNGAYKQLGFWFIDENTNVVLCIDIQGNLIYAQNLAQTYYAGVSSNFILNAGIKNLPIKYSGAVDSSNNLWVSLWGSGNVVRYNPLFNSVDITVSPFVDFSTTHPLSAIAGYSGQTAISSTYYTPFLSAYSPWVPISLDVDSNSNLWVGYANSGDPYNNGLLVQYTQVGIILNQILLPQLSIPRQINVDKNNNVNIVLDSYTTIPTTAIYRYSNTGTLLTVASTGSSLLPSLLSETLVSDTRGNTYYIDTTQNTLVTITSANIVTNVSLTSTVNVQGIFADTYNRINYVDIGANKILTSDNTSFNFTIPLSATRGDISGFNFISKFFHTTNQINYITGQSTPFNIYPQTGNSYIGKINEDFDASAYYKSLRLQESLLDKDIFFNDFLGTIVGNISSDYTTLGKTVYEKIANFVDNNSDIDSSNVSSLISQCIQYSIPYENLNYQFPPDLQKIIDLLSINFNNLQGNINNYGIDLDNKNSPSGLFGINLGTQMNIFTDTFSLSDKIVAFERYSQKYKVAQTASLSLPLSTVLPLSSFSQSWGWGLIVPPALSGTDVRYYYDFYRYISTSNNVIYDSIINWKDILTTSSLSAASYSSWIQDGGIMDQLISQRLATGLNLLP